MSFLSTLRNMFLLRVRSPERFIKLEILVSTGALSTSLTLPRNLAENTEIVVRTLHPYGTWKRSEPPFTTTPESIACTFFRLWYFPLNLNQETAGSPDPRPPAYSGLHGELSTYGDLSYSDYI